MMRRKIGALAIELILLLFSVIYITPILLTVMNAFKSNRELIRPFYSLPKHWDIGIFKEAYEVTRLGSAFLNSAMVAGVSLFGILLIGSLASYALARRESRYNRVLYFLFVSGLILPFHVIMVPVMKVVGVLHLNGRLGLMIMYISLGMSLAVFMMYGYIRSSIPRELEEAMTIDGASALGVYRNIILPLIKPIVVVILMWDTVWIWNDFLLPSLLLTSPFTQTLPLTQFRLYGRNLQKFNLQFAAFTMGFMPMLVLFFTCQKWVFRSVIAGSLKG
jgi:raffinose/stachyose/melibiose transport system permease protein